jgi:glycosyltransferase involved in cell wall biosynthesis
MIHEELTIVIPHKNDPYLNQMLFYLSTQNNIQGTRVIIADNSDIENYNIVLKQFVDDFKDTLKIEIIKGGFPSRARYNGAKLVKTKYVLFLDSDIFLLNKNTITDIFNELVLYNM